MPRALLNLKLNSLGGPSLVTSHRERERSLKFAGRGVLT